MRIRSVRRRVGARHTSRRVTSLLRTIAAERPLLEHPLFVTGAARVIARARADIFRLSRTLPTT
jgi:hypothetical protein